MFLLLPCLQIYGYFAQLQIRIQSDQISAIQHFDLVLQIFCEEENHRQFFT